jgi:hypothetical protein
MRCHNCNSVIDKDSNYCSHCGSNVSGTIKQNIRTGDNSINIGLGINNTITITSFDELKSFIDDLKENINEFNLNDESKQKANSDINTILTQLSSSTPKNTKIQQCLKTLRNVLEGTTGSIIATGILNQLSHFVKWS